ncbi:la protein [Vespula maculifrons]|uniref:La protein n=1 Tax=Vespula maculifrons TaxID=7453 RepID=A0ABD2CR46_VESMC
MANGQEEYNTEKKDESVTEEVKKDKPVENAKDDTKTEETKETKESSEPTEELLEQIKDQIEFYFGNVNMQRDKFLTEQIKLDEGWIPLSVMLNFNMLATMTTDCDIIVKSLESSELIEISEDKKKIRRSPKFPLPIYNEEYRKAQEAKTVYMKGFPLENINIQKLKTYFKQYEPYENIVMRKYLDKDKTLHFKGSIYLQFKTLDDAKTFMARESVKYNETELIRKWAADYNVERASEKEERKQRIQEARNKKTEAASKDSKAADNVNLPKGAIIHMKGMPDDCTRDIIRTRFEEFEIPIAYIHFESGDKEAWIRFQEENAAKTILEKLSENKILIEETEVTCRVLENEEEQKYLDEVKKYISNLRQRHKSRNENKKNRTGHKGGRKRPATSPADHEPAKTAAVE